MKMVGLLPATINNNQLKTLIFDICLLSKQLGFSFCFFLGNVYFGLRFREFVLLQQTLWTRPCILDNYHTEILAGWLYLKLEKNSASSIN